MAVYKIFPTKDATIYSEYPVKNTGIDEILELNLSLNSTNPTSISGSFITEVSRFLIKFSQEEINNLFTNKIGNNNYQAYLKFYLALEKSIPLEYTLECFPISGSWNMGTGRYANSPETTNGVSWEYRAQSGSNPWLTSSFSTNVTASFISTSYQNRPGGGNWYTGSNNLNLKSTQSFDYTSNKDISFNVTNTLIAFNSNSIYNDGFIIKNSSENEFNPLISYDLKYFSLDTHTIFPPELEVRWNDYSFNTGSITASFMTDLNPVVTISNNKGSFRQDSIQKFRVYSRDKFPNRVFQTSSYYLYNKFLPTSSYYSIIDYKTGTVVIDFDSNFTKISTDSTSSYFNLYMSGLQPERYYKIIIKSIFDGNELLLDDEYYFKVLS